MSTQTNAKALYKPQPLAETKKYLEDPLPQTLWFNLIVYILQTQTTEDKPFSKEDVEVELFKIIPYEKDARRLLDTIPTIDKAKDIEDVYDTIAVVYGGRIVTVPGKPKKYYFEPFINPSDLNMIKGSILSDKYLSDKEKDYHLSRRSTLSCAG